MASPGRRRYRAADDGDEVGVSAWGRGRPHLGVPEWSRRAGGGVGGRDDRDSRAALPPPLPGDRGAPAAATPRPVIFVEPDEPAPGEEIKVVRGDPWAAVGAGGGGRGKGPRDSSDRPNTAPSGLTPGSGSPSRGHGGEVRQDAGSGGAKGRSGSGRGVDGLDERGADVLLSLLSDDDDDRAPLGPPDRSGAAGPGSDDGPLPVSGGGERGYGGRGGMESLGSRTPERRRRRTPRAVDPRSPAGRAAAGMARVPSPDDRAQLKSLMSMLDDADSQTQQLLQEATPASHPSAPLSSRLSTPPRLAAGTSASPRSGAGSAPSNVARRMGFADRPSPAGSARSGASGSTAAAASVFQGVKAKLKAMSLELETKARTIATLQKRNRDLKARAAAATKAAKADTDARVAKVQASSKALAKRHLTFIDELIKDKETLSKKLDAAAEERKTLEAQWQQRLKVQQQRQGVDVRRARDQWAAAEKAWEAEKVRAIKESTIKGLEPEIQRMLDKHKTETNAIKQAAQAEVRRQREVMEAKYHEQRLRQQEAVDVAVAAALSKARDEALTTRKKMIEDYEEQLRAMRGRLTGEIESEHSRIAESQRQTTRRHQEELLRVRQLADRQLEEVQARLNHEREDAARRVAAAVAAEQQRHAIEREAWQNRQRSQLRREATEAERSTKAELIAQRDAQVKKVIQRLDEEMEAAKRKLRDDAEAQREELVRAHEKEARRLEADLADARRQHRDATEARKEVASSGAVAREKLQARVQRMQQQVDASDAEANRLRDELAAARREADRERSRLSAELASVTQRADDEIEQLQQRLDELRTRSTQAEARLTAEIAMVKKSKAEELDRVAARVKAALAKRDKVIESLREGLEAATAAQRETEALLERQRRELLGDDA